jgi:hypothetical protein
MHITGIRIHIDRTRIRPLTQFPACLDDRRPLASGLALTSLAEADYPPDSFLQMGQRHFNNLRDCGDEIYPLLRGGTAL